MWDPEATKIVSVKTQQAACDFNIFEGMELHGAADVVICNGSIVVDSGELNVEQGAGRYVPCPPNSVYIYGRVEARDLVSYLNLPALPQGSTL